jgi:FkbM family methyltransferase
VLDLLLRPVLRLPHFKGKSRLEGWLRRTQWQPRRTRVKYDLLMELDPQEWLQLQLFESKWMEPQTLRLYERILRPGDVFVDVGAHVGFHSLLARHLIGPHGFVIAVEPQPYNAGKLLANWRANGFTNIHLVVGAAGDANRALIMFEQTPTDRSLLSIAGHGKNEGQRVEVQVHRLDGILAALDVERTRLVKVDVEGYELDVLKGLGDRLRGVENCILEFYDWPQRRGDNNALLTLLRDSTFDLFTITGLSWTPGDPLPENNLWARKLEVTAPTGPLAPGE